MIASLNFEAVSLTCYGGLGINSHESLYSDSKHFISRIHLVTAVLVTPPRLMQVIKTTLYTDRHTSTLPAFFSDTIKP